MRGAFVGVGFIQLFLLFVLGTAQVAGGMTAERDEGVIDYQGRVVPVVDLRRRFQLAAPSPGPQTRMLVLTTGVDLVAVVVDAVLDVRPLEDTALAAPPAFFRGLAAEYLRGLARRDGELVVVLDAERLLSSRERLALEPGLQSDPDA